MKVLQLGKAYPPVNLGGVEVVIKLITEGLNKKGVECDALGVNNVHTYVKEEGKYGGVVYRAKLVKKLFSTLLSIQLIKLLDSLKSDYDIIHIHSPDPMAALALLMVRPKCKVVLHWHSDILKQKVLLFFYKPVLYALLNRSDLILSTSPNYIEGSDFLQRYKYKTEVLPIGMDVEKPEHNEQLNIKEFENNKIVFSLGRLVYYKGYKYLIEAAKYLPSEYVVLIAGDGDERNELEQRIKAYNLTNRVKLLGKITDAQKDDLFKRCDIFALSSIYRTEAYAIVQVEAMAYGKPIISTNIPNSGVSWVNQNEITGFVVPICDSKAIAEAILKIMNEVGLYQKISMNSKERYLAMFTQDKMIISLIAYYKKLIDLS